jgi:hypothetical protein
MAVSWTSSGLAIGCICQGVVCPWARLVTGWAGRGLLSARIVVAMVFTGHALLWSQYWPQHVICIGWSGLGLASRCPGLDTDWIVLWAPLAMGWARHGQAWP